ncbi:MAG: ATP-binding cassette domain-containing protein [Firmicutes bacterium]|nr:ATP-binding cassette domain-containing protein [Bacillota bacterium]
MIRVTDLAKTYPGGVRAVSGVTFDVRPGEIFGFLGPNGAGKTTTILMLITLLRPTSGRAVVSGHDITTEPDRVRLRIGYVSQDIAVDETLTGRENLYLQGRLYHLDRETIVARTREVLEMVDLTERADARVSTYSGGMRKRLDIAEGLIHRPEVLFLDEPTLGLDIQTRHRIWDYIRRLRSGEGITVFLTTHYMEEADQLCDRIGIIDHGRLVALGTPDELKASIGGDLLLIEVAGRSSTVPGDPAAAGLVRLLESVEGVTRVSPAEDGRWLLVVRSGEETAPRVLAALGGAGLEVRSLAMKKPTLDDVFLHYTGRELRETGGGQDFLRHRLSLRRARM